MSGRFENTNFREMLASHPLRDLRIEVRGHNIKGYSTMKKGELIDEMAKRRKEFSHMKKRGLYKPSLKRNK